MSQFFYSAVRKVVHSHGLPGQRLPQPRGTFSAGRIAQLFVGQGYGFICTADSSRQIYFHRADLREGTSINDLCISDGVTFELLEDRVSGARALRVATNGGPMSARNGDRARFQKDRRRKLLRRQRIQEALKVAVRERGEAKTGPADPVVRRD